MKERLHAVTYYLRPGLFALLLVFIATSDFKLSATEEDLKISRDLVSDVEELNLIVYRYQLAGGWFSETDDAKLILTRLAMAHGDFGLPRLFQTRERRFIAVTADTPPLNKKWVYWNNSTRRFQLWRGVAPHDVQIVTRFLTENDKTFAVKSNRNSFDKKSAKAK